MTEMWMFPGPAVCAPLSFPSENADNSGKAAGDWVEESKDGLDWAPAGVPCAVSCPVDCPAPCCIPSPAPLSFPIPIHLLSGEVSVSVPTGR